MFNLTLVVIVLSALAFKSFSRYYFKQFLFALGILLAMILTFACFPVIFIKPSYLNEILAYNTRVILSLLLGIDVVIEGEENLETGGESVIYVVNHQSTLDLLMLAFVHQPNGLYLAKKELAYIPLLGWIFYLGGNVLVDRGNKASALSSFSTIKTHLHSGTTITIFPEGTRSNSTKSTLLPFKKGAFHLAHQTRLNIIPVVCANQSGLYHEPSRVFEEGSLVVSVLERVKVGDSETVEELMERVKESMAKELVRLDEYVL